MKYTRVGTGSIGAEDVLEVRGVKLFEMPQKAA